MENSQPGPAVSGVVVTTTHVRGLAVAAYLARFKSQSRIHTESDLRGYLIWCEARGLDPVAATRPHIELYLRWLQEVRRYRPSTVSRRMSVVAGFYRTCVIDSVLEHSPAEYVRRPNVPAESPTLGLTHLQFEALLTAATSTDASCREADRTSQAEGEDSRPRAQRRTRGQRRRWSMGMSPRHHAQGTGRAAARRTHKSAEMRASRPRPLA